MRENLEKNLPKDYVVRTSVDETPRAVVIHVSSNDITKMNYKTINVQDLAQGIIDTGLKCKSYRLMAFYIENNDFKLKKVMLLLCYLPFYINLCITCLEKSI